VSAVSIADIMRLIERLSVDITRLIEGFRFRKVSPEFTKIDAFTDIAAVGVPRYGAGAFIYSNYLYIVGGIDASGRVSVVIERINLETYERDCPQYLPSPRAHFAYGFVNGKFYIIGGVGSDMLPKNNIYEYDPSTNQVVEKSAKLPKGVAFCASTVYNGRIYVIGGMDHDGNILADVYEYDPVSDTVAQKASMNVARENLACAELGGKIYCFGGDDGSTTLEVIEVYDPSTNTWSIADIKMPAALAGLRASKIVINSEEYILLVGG
jgi:Uncharacterized protein conserved in bacteria